MALCRCCNRDMMETYGCNYAPIIHHGKKYRPIKVGAPGDIYFDNKKGRCGDCGAVPGHYHHVGCDLERCPVCGDQLISCRCNDADNRYWPAPYDKEPTVLSQIEAQADKNLLQISLIDSRQKALPDPWFRFLLVSVPMPQGPNRKAYAIYQITKVTQTYCDVSAVSVSGVDYQTIREKFPQFMFDFIVPEWGLQTRLKRTHINKMLTTQDRLDGDYWTKLRHALNERCKIHRVIETFYALQTENSEGTTSTKVCPRCGGLAMDDNPRRNALSRHATVYICDACGRDEAIRDWNQNVLQLENWACAALADREQ